MFLTYATNELPAYEYTPIADEVLIRIYQFDHEETIEGDDNQEPCTQYVYNTNEFKVHAGEITEEEIAADPLSFLDYTTTEYTLKERIEAMEEAIDFLLMGGLE